MIARNWSGKRIVTSNGLIATVLEDLGEAIHIDTSRSKYVTFKKGCRLID